MLWPILILSYMALFVMGFIDNARGPVYPSILAEFSLTPVEGSWFFSIAAFGGLVSALSHRFWLKKFGPFTGIKFFIFMMAIGCLGMGQVYQQNYWALLLFSFIFGLGTGGNGICMNLLTARSCPPKYRRQAFSGLHATYALAALVASFSLTYLKILGANHWQKLFQYFFIVPATLFIWALTLKPPHTHLQKEPPQASFFWKVIIGLALGFYISAEIVSSSRMVLYLTTYLTMAPEMAAFYLALFFLFLLLGRLLFTSFHLPGGNLLWLMTSLLFSIFFYLIGLHIHPIGLSLTGLMMSFFFPCFIDWVSDLFPTQSDSIISAMLSIMGIMIVIMHDLVGLINQLFGIQGALHIGPLFCLISIILIFIISHLKRRSLKNSFLSP